MLENKVAIVTGASSGIGYSTSLALSKAGARVAVGARRTDRLQELEAQIIKNKNNKGEQIFVRKLDVTNKSDCDSFVDAVVKKWGRMIDVNIKGVLYCTSAVIPYMLDEKSGHIVNISSIAGRIVFAGGSVYCATKHAITAFSEGL